MCCTLTHKELSQLTSPSLHFAPLPPSYISTPAVPSSPSTALYLRCILHE
ncbi:hypothetical protein COCVIDRAFT_105032 [Bipolaris victoriae FI3]|uniref:Uncharacterized protein n=1 Tax=Bipolaris victoriae (strain FI3) TaxID=930091 RepID=W7E9H5_BIPV3|nr:hypothetical protein COCVIDRAFT_105032 [Bipolaris victoriae FI3]